MSAPLRDLAGRPGDGGGLRTQLVRGVVGVGGLQLVALPLGFVASVLLARGLGPDGFGRYAFIVSVVTVVSIPMARGMPLLLTREVAGYHHGGDWGLFRGLLRRALEVYRTVLQEGPRGGVEMDASQRRRLGL